MTVKLLDVGAFKAAAKDGARPDGAVMRATNGEPVVGEGESRTVTFVFSDGSVDRMGDTIDPKGWDLSEFAKNSVALWCHDSSAPPIGRASNLRVTKGKLIGDIEFMTADISPFADSVFKMVKGGYLNAVSVGFIPTKYSFVNDDSRPWGIDFQEQSLLEISVCSVPANPNALIDARAKGIDLAPLLDWAEKLLDGGGSVMVPRDLLEETFRAAKTPRTVRQKYLSKDAADWKVGAARDLPVDDADAWDGPAASKRMLDAAGFDGETPDAAKAARGFLVHDAANPTLRGSYKLPFADIVGGEIKAIKGGVHAAASRLTQTDAPAPVLDDAKTVLEAYEKKIGEMAPAKAIGDGNAPTGSCGRGKDAECGMKNPAECAIHAPPAEKTIAVEAKAGRKIGSANMALLDEAKAHHAAATKSVDAAMACIQKIQDSNATDPDGDQPADANDLTVAVPAPEEDPRAKRIREAKALKASVKI